MGEEGVGFSFSDTLTATGRVVQKMVTDEHSICSITKKCVERATKHSRCSVAISTKTLLQYHYQTIFQVMMYVSVTNCSRWVS